MSVRSDWRKAALLRLFGSLLFRPGSGVTAVLDASPSLALIALALIPVGLLRGVAEGLWYYLMTGRGSQVLALLAEPSWYTRYGGPYLPDLSYGRGTPGGAEPW